MVVGVEVAVLDDGCADFTIFPSTYPSSPLDLSSWVMVVFHLSKLSLLNFCSSERIVKVGIPDDIVYRSRFHQWSSQYGDMPVLHLAAEKCDFSTLTEAAALQLHY